MARQLGTATLGLASETGFPPIGGDDPAILSYPAFDSSEALRILPTPAGTDPITDWIVGLDLYIPQPAGSFVSLLQTGTGDGEVFLRDNGDGTAGIGISGVYDGAVPFDAWTRIVVSVTQESGDTILRKFVDGVLVGTQNLGATDRWEIDPAAGLGLFTDNDGETAAGAVSTVFFTTDVPTPPEVEGAVALTPVPDAAGFFPAPPSQGALQITFANEDIAPDYGSADVFLDGFGFRSPAIFNDSAIALASQFGIDGPAGEDIPVLDYAAYAPAEGIQVDRPALSGDLSSYTAIWDLRVDDLPGFQGLFQTDTSQSGDGELFIRSDGGIGINGDYDGTVIPNTWHRLVITVEDQGDGTAILSKYLDGAFLDSQSVSAGRFTIDQTTGFLLLTDNDNETSPGYLAHFGLSEEVLGAAAIAALGGADGDGPFDAPAAGATKTLTLQFDSSWRPFDNQTAVITALVDGVASEIFRYDSSNTTDAGQRNETVTVAFDVPADAAEIELAFQYLDADNDWWWAIDNISLSDDGGTIFAEDFDGLTPDLQPAADEAIDPAVLGWTHTTPAGWTRDVDAPQGTTEWQGWSFATPTFWTSADGQQRTDFTLGTGVIAIADGDEWDDFNGGSVAGDDFNTVLTTPAIDLGGAGSTGADAAQFGFDGYQPTVEFGFQAVEVVDLEDAAPIQDNIKDLLLTEGSAATEIDLLAAFGPGATNFAVTSADGTIVDATIEGTTLSLTPGALGHADITVTAEAQNGAPLAENFRAIVAGENAYVFAIIPDTQDYTSNPGIADTFGNMTDWLLAQQDSLAIEHAIHVGDIVQFGAVSQWQIAEDAMERLDGQLSYTLAVGNHDQQRPGFSSAFSFETDVDTYFTPEQVGATAAQGGGTYDGFDVGPDVFGNGDTYADSIRNHYTTLTTPDGTDWLIFSLEFGMPDDVLRWAGEVIEAHLDHRVIIDTHSWNGGDGRVTPTTEPLNTDNGGWGYDIRENPRNVNDGEDAWRELASKYPNVTFTFNGHNFMGGAETVVSYGAGGNPTHQIFVNYQNGAWRGVEGVGTNGGNGALRLIVMDPDNDRITTHTKLVELDTYFNEFPDHEEVFEGVDLGAPEQIAIAKAGETMIVTGDGKTGSVTLDPSGTIGDVTGATFEWFAADGEKLGETDGAPLTVDLQTGTTRVTLKVTDQDGNVSTDDKAVIVEAPDALLTETFDDGDLAGWIAPDPDVTDVVEIGTDVGFLQPAIDPGSAQIPLNLTFDSHWRPFDAQTGTVAVSFDGGAPVEILRYDSATTDDTSQRNETISIDFNAPASASDIAVLWRYDDADNDWYWAIDNVELAAGATTLLAEDFDALAPNLQPAVDEAVDPTILGWSHDAPAGWTRSVDPAAPQGTTEWRGWSFTTPEFWQATAAQARAEFTKGTGVIAVADGDEWDDFNGGAAGNADSLDTTIGTPALDLTAIGGGQPGGTAAGIVRVDRLAPDEGLLVTPSASGQLQEYTLIFDILIDDLGGTGFTALYQTDVTNTTDAELYLREDAGAGTIGISGVYDGAFAYGDWNRVAITLSVESGAHVLRKYIDGTLVGTQTVDGDVSDGSRWIIDGDQGFHLFAEPANFTSEIYANSVAFTTDVLSDADIAALGGVDVDGPLAGSANPDAFQFNFDGGLDGLDFGSATIAPVSLAGGADTSYLVKGSLFGNPNGEGEAALYQQSNGGDELLLWGDAAALSWSDYTFDVVIEPADNDTVGAVFYYQDAANHYKLTMNQQNDVRTLVKVQDGVETVLATGPGSYRHFAKQDLRIAVVGDQITITLDDEALFGGPITDAAPLTGGTVGVFAQFMDRVEFDNISVNPVVLAARALTAAPAGRWAVDTDGDGSELVEFTAHASLSAAGIDTYEWLVDGAVMATGAAAGLNLAPGETTVTLRVTDANGMTSEDRITVEIADNRAILAADDFEDGDLAGWTIVDEGDQEGPSDWQVVGGELVQASNIQSDQQGFGSNAFSVAGDGPLILRDGTYALWDDPAALGWTDYAFQATITPNDDDGIGLLFRYTDADNYYKLEADAQTGLVMLSRHLEGRETILARGYDGYTPGVAQDWRIEVEGGAIRTYIDGKAVFGTPIEDRTLTEGTVGLYGWGSEGLTFDDVTVTDLGFVPPPPPVLDVALIDTDTGARIATLSEGGTEILASDIVGRDLTLAAFVPDDSPYAGQVESIRLDFNDGEKTKVENFEPYSLFGDWFRIGFDKYRGKEGLLDQADNVLSLELFDENRGKGDLLDTVAFDFTVIDDVQPTEDDLRVFLIDGRRDTIVAELTDGTVIDRDLIAHKKLTIAAFVDDSFEFDVDSMKLTLNDRFEKVENIEPYSLFGDWFQLGWENYRGRRNILEEGENKIEFELYTDNHLRGDALGTVSIDFTVAEIA